MIWGLHSGGWMSGLTAKAEDKHRAQIELLAKYDLHATSWSAKELMEMAPERRDQIAGWLAEHDIHVNLGVGFDALTADAAAVRAGTDAAMKMIDTLRGPMRTPLCVAGINRQYHHYSRDMPVAQQIDVLSRNLAPLAKFCADAGCPLAIHTVTHFGEDHAELCRRTPGLGLLFDTANCFLIGEPPMTAAQACAPYTYGSHFKDHTLAPSFNPLGTRASGAVPGQGDCQLRDIYALLLKKAPAPEKLVMELEIDPVRDANDQPRDQREVLEESIAFIRSL